MPTLTVQGTLTDRGNATPFPVPLKVTLTLSRENPDYSYTDVLDVVCPAGGAFAAAFTVDDEVTDRFTTSGAPDSGSGAAGGHVAVGIAPYVPGAAPFAYTSAVLAFFTMDQTFLGVAESLVDALAVDLNLSGVAHYTFNAVIRSDDDETLDAFADVDQLLCEVLRDQTAIPAGNPAARLVAAPGEDGAPPDPEVEAAVDAVNDAIAGGPDEGQSFEEWEADLGDLVDALDDAGSPSPVPGAGTYSIVTTAPALRDGDEYTAHVLVRQRDLGGGVLFARFRSQGPDLAGKVVLRSPRLPVVWPGVQHGLITRVVRPTGIGTISTYLPDRTYQAPFVMIDPDLDIVDGALRVRGRVGVGTGANMVIAQVASIDVSLALTLVGYESEPFSMNELDDFFAIRVTGAQTDLLPGTDLDELPAWLWIAVGVPLGLSGAALTVALVAAIELALKPVVATMTRERILSELTTRLRRDVDDEIDRQLGLAATDFGVTLPTETEALLRAGAWFEAERLDIDADAATITGFGGVWDPLVGQLNSDCPLRSSTARRSVDLNAARTFEQAVDHPDLADWWHRYSRHRKELRRMLATQPTLLAKLAAFVRAHHGIAAGGNRSVIPAGLVADWLALSATAREKASPELAALLGDVDAVVRANRGRTVAEARRVAAGHGRSPVAPRRG